MHRLIQFAVVLCALLATSALALAYDDRDYCLGEARADRVACRGQYLNAVADCISYDNLLRYIDAEPAYISAEMIGCKADALIERTDCFASVDTCLED